MRNNIRILLAVTILALAALACQTLTGGDAPGLPSVNIPDIDVPTINVPDISSSDVILSDNFSSEQWGTGTDADSAVEYVNNALNFDVFTENYFVWSIPNNVDYGNIHMEVTVINNGTDSTTAFGLMCNKSVVNDFYYVAITPAGKYAIAEAATGEIDLFLTNNDEWADSDLIAQNADSYRVGMDCGNGRLTLYVDGVEIDSVSDSSYTSGQVAVMGGGGEDVGMTNNVSFDDFVMTELP